MSAALPAPCHGADAGDALPSGESPAHPLGTLAATIAGSSLAFVDGSIVNVALAAIGADLKAGAGGLAWIVNAYLLPLGALVLVGGVAGDRWGRRRVFLAGLAIFAVASVGCALAANLAALLAARVAQGVGAALLVPQSLALIGAAFRGEARGRAVGTWAAAGAIAGAIGPVVGGALVDAFGWRFAFAINPPLAAVAAACAWRWVDESADRSPPPFDLAGAALATLGLALLTFGLTGVATATDAQAARSSAGTVAWACTGAGLVALAGFVAVELRRGQLAMMPTALFATRTFAGISLLTFALYAALGGLLVVLPFVLVRGAHWSATAAGAALLPLPIAIGASSRAVGRLAERIGARPLLVAGPLVVAGGFALLLRVDAKAVDYAADVLPALAAIAVGMAISVAPLTTVVMATVDADHVGSASGVNNAIARVAGLLATALAGFVLQLDGGGAVSTTRVHAAALAGAALAAAAAVSAMFGIGPIRDPEHRPTDDAARQ